MNKRELIMLGSCSFFFFTFSYLLFAHPLIEKRKEELTAETARRKTLIQQCEQETKCPCDYYCFRSPLKGCQARPTTYASYINETCRNASTKLMLEAERRFQERLEKGEYK